GLFQAIFKGRNSMESKSIRASILSAVIFGAATVAQAAPITLTDSYSSDGNTVSGTLHGDLTNDVLTLNNAAPKSTLTVDLADPDPFPIGSQSFSSNYCLGFQCTITANLGG